MNPELTQWLITHLIAGALLGLICLAWSRISKRASEAQRSAVIGVFLAGLSVLTPLQGLWWPQIDVQVLQATELTLEPVSEAPIEDQPDTVNSAVLASEPTPQPETRPSALPTIFLSIWLLGTVMLLSRFLLGAWLWRRLWATSRIHEQAQEYELRLSERTRVPMASGRQILMPAEWLQWPAEDQKAALEHELAHARHHDGWVRGIAALATALHWPSPFVWLAEKRLRLAQEQYCDETVLAGGIDADAYARLLMRCAKAARQGSLTWVSPTVACMARPSQLAKRIEHIAQGAPPSRPACWRHFVLPLLILVAGMQTLHVRLVAQEANEEPSQELVAIEIKFIESDTPLPLEGVKRVGEHQRVWPGADLNALLRSVIRDDKTNTTSYPRMVTRMNQLVSIRSVVQIMGRKASLDEIGTPELDWGGVIFELTPSKKAEKIKLSGELGLSTQVGTQVDEAKGDERPIYEGIRVKIDHATLSDGDTLVIGPVKRPVENGESTPDLWMLVTPRRIAGDSQNADIQAQMKKSPKAMQYDFKDAALVDVLRFLATDARMNFIIGNVKPQQTASFSMKAPPLETLMHLCEKSGLRLKLSNSGIWIIGEPGTAMPTQLPGEAAKKLREQPKQRYDFAKAHAGDVVRFLAGDAGISLVGLSVEVPQPPKELTFSIEDSPFAVMEALCSMLGLDLRLIGNTWHVLSGESEVAPPKNAPETGASAPRGTELERTKAKLSSLPAGGLREDEHGKTTVIMLGDMILRPGGHVPALEANQTGRLRVKSIEKQQITFVWSEQGKEEVTFDLPLLEKKLLGQ